MESMTGYGMGKGESPNYKVEVFLRSLNSKGLEVSLRLPNFLSTLEPRVRELLRENFKRGSIFLSVKVDFKNPLSLLDLKKLREAISSFKELLKELNLSLSEDKIFEETFRFFNLSQVEPDQELISCLETALKEGIRDLKRSRLKEGENLLRDLEMRLKRIEGLLGELDRKKEKIYEAVKEKVLELARELSLHEENPLILNEITFLLKKMDVGEEITRLRSHLLKARELLKGEEVGRKLEFLAQEMHREVNTLSVKLPQVWDLALEIKGEVEKIKQQSANLV